MSYSSGPEDRKKGYVTSYEHLEEHYEFVEIGKDGVPVFRLKPEYRESKAQKAGNVGLAIIAKLFGL